MLNTPTLQEKPTDRPGLYAFRVTGTVTKNDMTAMAEYVNALFEAHDQIDMMLVFEGYDGSETGAGLSWENVKSRVAALSNVRHYLVVGAPESAADMISVMDKLIPVDAKAFKTEGAALAYLDQQSTA